MSDPEKSKLTGPPESPTTARELDFDDEPQDTPSSPSPRKASSKTSTSAPQPGSGEDVAPPKPPRPVKPEQQAESTLREAFPSIDAAVVKAVLRASGGRVEPAFNALLGMSDPDSQVEPEPIPPPQPPRPKQAPIAPTSTEESQLLADEQYARQLAEHYNSSASYNPSSRSNSGQRREPAPLRSKTNAGLRPNEVYDDREHSFIDDDLPVIRENLKKGFMETQSTINSWVNKLKKKIDGEEDEDFQGQPVHSAENYSGGPSRGQYGGRRSGEHGRRSADQERYDADPQVLGDDFTNLQLKDQETPQRRSTRPLANPDLFKPTPPRPQSNSGRRVSFQDGPPEEIDVGYGASPEAKNRSTSSPSAKSSKWQPLAAVDPSPVADHDPFSLGDSDDDDTKKKDVRADDNERLKEAAAEAMNDDISSPNEKKLEPQEKLGTKDVEAKKLVEKS